MHEHYRITNRQLASTSMHTFVWYQCSFHIFSIDLSRSWLTVYIILLPICTGLDGHAGPHRPKVKRWNRSDIRFRLLAYTYTDYIVVYRVLALGRSLAESLGLHTSLVELHFRIIKKSRKYYLDSDDYFLIEISWSSVIRHTLVIKTLRNQ